MVRISAKPRTGNAVLLYRTMAGMRQSEVASAVGIKQRIYSFYETGERQPDPAMAARIAELFKTDAALLFPAVAARKE